MNKPNTITSMSSRRKQSNPKPLKRDDEDDGDVDDKRPAAADDDDAEATLGEKPASTSSAISPQGSPSQPVVSPSPPPHPTPKVRLNTALATDPADNLAVSSGMEYLAALQPAFHQAALAGRLFPPFPSEVDPTVLPKSTRLKTTDTTGVVLDPRPVSVYMCAPCGIRFSSASTLEAHQTYYCSHRLNAKGRESDADDPKSPSTEEGGEPPQKTHRTGKQYGCPHCSYSADKKVSLNRHMRMHASSPIVPQPNVLTNGNAEPVGDSQLIDRYCQDCDIRFSSIKTLKAHKMHYCSSRHGKVSPGGKSGSTPESPPDHQEPQAEENAARAPQRYLILRTNPVLIVPYSLFQSAASFFPDSHTILPCQDTACVLLPNGTVQPMSQLIPPPPPTDETAILKDTRPLDRNRRPDQPMQQPTSPLDLSVRRNSTSGELVIDEDEKENVVCVSRTRTSPNEETIVCAPSIPVILAGADGTKSKSPTPPPKSPTRRLSNGYNKVENRMLTAEQQKALNLLLASSGRVPPPLLTSLMSSPLPGPPGHAELLPLLTDLQLRVPTVHEPVPQVLVKQGVSKCQECNIVFCKHESYLAHKKHYCSSRVTDGSSDSAKSPTDSISPGPAPANSEGNSSPAAVTKPTTLVQLICVACNTKFGSIDNLIAHQTYYCQQRTDCGRGPSEEKTKRCSKCKVMVTTGADHQCAPGSVSATSSGGWRCPCCDVVSPTAATAQKHMETHAGVRAFRCTICRYKGNTLRGMRTHIRMHLDKSNGDIQEENFISCIIDDNAVSPPVTLPPPPPPLPPPPPAPPAPVSPPTIKQETEEELVDVETDMPTSPAHSTCETSDETSASNNNGRRVPPGPNYCKTCDITFNYWSSLVAHKKFYCSHNASEAVRVTHSPRATPETSVG